MPEEQSKNISNFIFIVAIAVAVIFVGLSVFGLFYNNEQNRSKKVRIVLPKEQYVNLDFMNGDIVQFNDSLKTAVIDISFIDGAKVKIENRLVEIDSINGHRQERFISKMDSLNLMIDRYNDRVANLREIEENYTHKANVFYSIIILIITLFAFFGYRNFISIRESAKEDAKEKAQEVAKVYFTEEVELEINRILAKGQIAVSFFADLEDKLEKRIDEFEKKYEGNDDESEMDIFRTEIEMINNQIKTLVQMIKEK